MSLSVCVSSRERLHLKKGKDSVDFLFTTLLIKALMLIQVPSVLMTTIYICLCEYETVHAFSLEMPHGGIAIEEG